MSSPALLLASLPESERRTWLAKLTDDQARELRWRWDFWARPDQRAPPGDWFCWLINAGRGYGKTRTGAEWVRDRAESGEFKRMALVAETAADARDTMVGDREVQTDDGSGILDVCPPWNRPKYEPSKRRLVWNNPNFPSYGAMATTYSGDEPDQLRGPNTDTVWVDEYAKFKYPKETWANIEFGCRVGPRPQVCVTTTPRPIKELKQLMEEPSTVITTGSSYDNLANLNANYRRTLQRYEGTRLGRQEIYAEVLEDIVGALWRLSLIEPFRVRETPPLTRIVVGVDPSVADPKDSDEAAECGIVVVGAAPDESTGLLHGYVLDDASETLSPNEWAKRAVNAYHNRRADRVVAEVNNGGALVEATVRTVDANVSYSGVHASRGKLIRAEPVAALYEQGRVHHVGLFAELEDQMCSYAGRGRSPDRMDALVWALTELIIDDEPTNVLDIDPGALGAGYRPSPWKIQ